MTYADIGRHALVGQILSSTKANCDAGPQKAILILSFSGFLFSSRQRFTCNLLSGLRV